jgi:hypothetical protein
MSIPDWQLEDKLTVKPNQEITSNGNVEKTLVNEAKITNGDLPNIDESFSAANANNNNSNPDLVS